MKILVLILSLLLAAFMLFGGLQHFLKPAFYLPFVPAFLPWRAAFVPLSGAVEILLGATLLVSRRRALAGWGVLLLMLAFLPVHLWDAVRVDPAIGSHHAALIRLPFQFLFILWAWFVASQAPSTPTQGVRK